MIRTPIAGLREHVGETVTIAGWVHALRLQRAMQFVARPRPHRHRPGHPPAGRRRRSRRRSTG